MRSALFYGVSVGPVLCLFPLFFFEEGDSPLLSFPPWLFSLNVTPGRLRAHGLDDLAGHESSAECLRARLSTPWSLDFPLCFGPRVFYLFIRYLQPLGESLVSV